MIVREIMTPNPIRIRPESDYLAAIAILRASKHRRLPVVDGQGAVVGIVTLEQLQAAPLKISKSQVTPSDGVQLRVSDVMSSPAISIPPEYPIEEAAQLMFENSIGFLPVVESDQLVGAITDTDIFRTLFRLFGGGSGTLRISCEIDNRPGQLAAITQKVAELQGNILSLASFPAQDPTRANITLRVENVDLQDLLKSISSQPKLLIRHTWEPG